MKRIYWNLLSVVILFSGCHSASSLGDFQKLHWLLGTWQGEADGRPFYETWIKKSDTEFVNVNYTLCNGDTVRGGSSRIEWRDGHIAYTSDQLVWELSSLDDSVVVFESEEHGERFTFTLTAGGRWRANLKYPQSQIEYELSRIVSLEEVLTSPDTSVQGYYSGYIEFEGKRLNTSITLDITDSITSAYVTTPDNLQLNMPFSEVCFDPPHLRLVLRDGTQNLELIARVDREEITGKLEGDIPASIYLKRVDDPVVSTSYAVEDLVIHASGADLPCSLYLPVTEYPVAAVIMICGSGQHIREEYNGWADMLASKGIAVLTYDKRNVSSYPALNIRQVSSDIVLPGQLEADIQVAIDLLKGRAEIDAGKIGLIGFSQGAVLAPIVAASRKDVSFIVAVSGNVTTDREFVITQSVNRLRQHGGSEENIREAREIWNELFTYVKTRKGGDDLQGRIDRAYEQGFGRFALPRRVPNEDEMKYLSTWNSFEHDPAVFWNQLDIPCYIVFGGQDMFIPVQESVEILSEMGQTGSRLFTVKVYPEADHFIKRPVDPNNFDFPKYAEGYIEELTGWVLRRAE